MAEKNEFQPDWISVPGDTIIDLLEERNLSPTEFALRMQLTIEETNELLHGGARITTETARRLEIVLGGSIEFWMARELNYQQDVARRRRQHLSSKPEEWMSELPVKDMIKFGWLQSAPDRGDDLAACLHFFGVPDVDTWRETYREVLEMTAFRTSSSFRSQHGAVATWLRQGQIESDLIDCKNWDAKLFEKQLRTIRHLTRQKDPASFIPELQKRCAACGVAVVIVRAPSGCRASGATRFLSLSKALLLLSFRYLSDDHFWFTFFHEAGHLILHGKKVLFLEGPDLLSTKEEEEANEFAARLLIPLEFQARLQDLSANGIAVMRFAKLVGVSPGIVVGQLQHRGRIRRNQLNNLKRRFKWGME